jgi:hypothetical protein
MMEIPDEFALPEDVFARQRSLVGAHVLSRRTRRLQRRLSVAVVAAALLSALLITPAVGFGDRLLDLFQRPAAPPEVQSHFAANDEFRKQLFAHADAAGHALHDRFSPVVAGEARGIAAIESADGPIYLWAAPTEDGRQCWLIQAGADVATGRPSGYGACDEVESERTITPTTLWMAERPSLKIVHARVYDDAITRVDVLIEDRPTVSLPVVAGHALGTVAKESRLLAFVGRDADSDEVARTTMP